MQARLRQLCWVLCLALPTFVHTPATYAEIATPDRWAPFAPLPIPVNSPVLVTGPDGRIYAIGGMSGMNPVATVQAYTPTIDSWQVVAPLPSPRTAFAATADVNGLLYVFGGTSCFEQGCSTTEIDTYSPATNVWSVTGQMPADAVGISATSAPDGTIYYLGLFRDRATPSVDTYDPATNKWQATAPPPPIHRNVAATLGPDGLLYVVDGAGMVNGSTVNTYNPVTNQWRIAAATPDAQSGFVVVFGPDGLLYVIGGYVAHEVISPSREVNAYDPTIGRWTPDTPLPVDIPYLAGAVGPDGRIYVVGSQEQAGEASTYANEVLTPACQYVLGFHTLYTDLPSIVGSCLDNEQHNPANGDALQHTTGGLFVWRRADNWTAFTDGYHTWVNGPHGLQERLNTERFPWETSADSVPVGTYTWIPPVPAAQAETPPNTWEPFAPLPVDRDQAVLVTGQDGRLYALGGVTSAGTVANVEAYTAATDSWTERAPLPTPRALFVATTGPTGLIYVIGGSTCGRLSCYPTTEIDAYDPAHDTWRVAGLLPELATGISAATGPDGRLYYLGIFGTVNATSNPPPSLEVFNPATRQWLAAAAAPPLTHSAVTTFGANGLLYVIDGGTPNSSMKVWAYDPATDSWQFVASGGVSRDGFAAVAAPDGRLYVFGGATSLSYASPAHLTTTVTSLTPMTGTWAPLPPLLTALGNVSATVGPDGRLYVSGNTALYAYGATANEVFTPPCQYVLGFQHLYALLPDTIGSCLDDEQHNPTNGDALQYTTGGLLVWRKADNFTAFTDGYHTWVNGPYGVQERLNTQRFPWESNPDHLPLAS